MALKYARNDDDRGRNAAALELINLRKINQYDPHDKL